MKIDAEKLSQLQVVLVTDNDGVSFSEIGKEGDEHVSWYLSDKDRIYKVGPIVNGDHEYFDDIHSSTFLDVVKDKELVASWGPDDNHNRVEDWNEFAKVFGISALVSISTKVPGAVARRFEEFANQESTKSGVLRELIYTYVKGQLVSNVDKLIFKERI